MVKVIIPIVAIVAIVTVEVVALCSGIDGSFLSVSYAAIGGICGYWIKSLRKK